MSFASNPSILEYREYQEFGRTQIAVFSFVLNRLLTLPTVISSQFQMQELLPQVRDTALVENTKMYKYFLIHLYSSETKSQKKAFLRLKVIAENKMPIQVKVTGWHICTADESSSFDIVNGAYSAVN